MKRLILLSLAAITLVASPSIYAVDYVFEVCLLEYTGEKPNEKTMEALLQNDAALKFKTGPIGIEDTKTTLFGKPTEYKYPVAYSVELKPIKYESEKIGLYGEVRISEDKGDHARVDFSASEVRLAPPLIVTSKIGQIAQPTFHRYGVDKGTIELTFGRWLFFPYPPQKEGNFMLAYRLEKKKS